ncbi:MAG TPA: hypothetical protein VNN76_01240 [Bacteroidota bacterium]|nr:hypothetical protein [Bacteroidota bacterium]
MKVILAYMLVFQCCLAQSGGPIGSASKADDAHVFQSRETKSVTVAIVASLILPGAGEWYAGNLQTGRYFLMADAGLWLTYAGFNFYGDWIRDDARDFAAMRAGVDLRGKDEQFETNVGNFMNVHEYNQARLRDRQYNRLYDPNSSYAWQWDSDASRMRFRDLRIRSDQLFQNGRFVIAAMVVNRIISAFVAARAAAAYNRSMRSESNWRFDAGVQGGLALPHGFEVRISKAF